MELRDLDARQLGRELIASTVVFLVALPLALGVALASGVPVALGLVSAIVGGVVVGALSGCRLQVTGPAAGLIVLVWSIVDGWGLIALGVAGLAAGAVQLLAGTLRMGRWFRAVSPALIYGLLAGIGALIVLGQLHVMLGATPPGGGVADLLALPSALATVSSPSGGAALAVGLVTLALLFLWDRRRPARMAAVPGALIAIGAATALTHALGLPVATVQIPHDLAGALNVPTFESFGLLLDGSFLSAVAALTAISAAESLLSASATDELHDGARTDFDKELRALGIGNLVCGALGALPLTGVIVRSAANVKGGARTRLSSILHGVWLLALVVLAPAWLELLPIPALAGLLVYVGLLLMKPAMVRKIRAAGHGEIWVYAATAVGIVTTGLLTGLAIGFAVAVGKLIYAFTHLEIEVERRGRRYDVNLHGAATFVAIPSLSEALERIGPDAEVHVHIGRLSYIDHASHALLRQHEARLVAGGGSFITEWDSVRAKSGGRANLIAPRARTALGAPLPE